MILDTNALSAVAEGQPGAVAQLSKARQPSIPVIVLGEYRFGIAQSRRRIEYEDWLAEALSFCRILDVIDDTSARYAELRQELRLEGTPIPTNDLWIAALCRQHGLAIMSRDQHFDFVKGLRRLGW